MFQFCFFISIAYSYCVQTEPAKVHYPTVIERSTEMITRHEWLALEAYPDTKGWSIGYGTRSYAGEVITKQEAYQRMLGLVSTGVYRVMHDFPDADENQVVALTSIFYNCWSGYLRIKKEGMQVIGTPRFCMVKGKPDSMFTGLVKRRAEERALIFWAE